jgi:GxxExxY protein
MQNLNAETSPETHAIIGALLEVHGTLGCGFLEAVYQEALAVEFASRGLPAQREVPLPIRYKGQVLPTRYRADFVCGDVLVELKAQTAIGPLEEAQVLHYLRATGLPIALLANFGTKSLQLRRFVGPPAKPPSVESV